MKRDGNGKGRGWESRGGERNDEKGRKEERRNGREGLRAKGRGGEGRKEDRWGREGPVWSLAVIQGLPTCTDLAKGTSSEQYPRRTRDQAPAGLGIYLFML